jgi:hypothetical protein
LIRYSCNILYSATAYPCNSKEDYNSQQKVIQESRTQALLKLYQLDIQIIEEQEATLLTTVVRRVASGVAR